jgi:hypothetical protein
LSALRPLRLPSAASSRLAIGAPADVQKNEEVIEADLGAAHHRESGSGHG